MSRAPTCEICRNAAPVVVVADSELIERELCRACWQRLEKVMDLQVLHFATSSGDPTL